MFLVYILQNPSGRFYIGHTQDLGARLASHNDGGPAHGHFTRKNGPWRVVWTEAHPDRGAAMVRERQIKGMKSARWIREHLLEGRVPKVRD